MPKFLFVFLVGIALYASYAISLHGGLGGFVAGIFVGVTATLFLQRTRIPQNAAPTTAVQVNNIDTPSASSLAMIDAIVQRRVAGAIHREMQSMLASGDSEDMQD